MGEHPDHAVAMLGECISLTIESALSASFYDLDGLLIRSRVEHPTRYGELSHEDECWEFYQRFLKREPRWTIVGLDNLQDQPAIVNGHVFWQTRAGVVMVDAPRFQHAAWHP
jgi:hypothetical protein